MADQADASAEALSEKSTDHPAAEIKINVRRYALDQPQPFYIVDSDDLVGAMGSGHSMQEALAAFCGCIPDLWSVMTDDIKEGREPTAQYLSFQRLLSDVDRSDEPERTDVSLNQPSLNESKSND